MSVIEIIFAAILGISIAVGLIGFFSYIFSSLGSGGAGSSGDESKDEEITWSVGKGG